MNDDLNSAQEPLEIQQLMAVRAELATLQDRIDLLHQHGSTAEYPDLLARYGPVRQQEQQLSQQVGQRSMFAVRRGDWIRRAGIIFLTVILAYLLFLVFAIVLAILFTDAF